MGGGGWGGPMSLSKGGKTHAHLLRRTCFSNHPGDGVHTAKPPAANGLIFVMALAPALREGGKHGAAGTWRDASHHGYVERHHQTQWQTVKLDLNLTPSSLPEGGKRLFLIETKIKRRPHWPELNSTPVIWPCPKFTLAN